MSKLQFFHLAIRVIACDTQSIVPRTYRLRLLS